jgi:hypothetical protein
VDDTAAENVALGANLPAVQLANIPRELCEMRTSIHALQTTIEDVFKDVNQRVTGVDKRVLELEMILRFGLVSVNIEIKSASILVILYPSDTTNPRLCCLADYTSRISSILQNAQRRREE